MFEPTLLAVMNVLQEHPVVRYSLIPNQDLSDVEFMRRLDVAYDIALNDLPIALRDAYKKVWEESMEFDDDEDDWKDV